MTSYDNVHPAIYDVIIVGAGHAGIEAALASARMGRKTLLLTISLDTIGQMPCNPSIGGIGKGHLVREIDALGGEMGLSADLTGIQYKMLNVTRGPSVQAPRFQSDKRMYRTVMALVVEKQPGLDLLQDLVDGIEVQDSKVTGVVTRRRNLYRARSVVITAGTFMRGLIHTGLAHYPGGRADEQSAENLSSSLISLGIELGRLKTGTPARINRNSVDFSKCEPQTGDENPLPFSYRTQVLKNPQVPCWLTHTTPATHEIILKNLDRSPLYGANKVIVGTGARYCPSLEDKVVRFRDREGHHIFLEPEGYDTEEIYVSGASNSLPEDVQTELIHSIPGLENARIMRMAYAIEYDFVLPRQLDHSLQCRTIKGLFFAGQVNGTSGYEEAAAQGLMAGINAALSINEEKPFILHRSEAYIGVLIDDIVSKGVTEPYRMFTSRAEYRLILRYDNADRRLMEHGHRLGLVGMEQVERMREKYILIERMSAHLEKTFTPKDLVRKLIDDGKIETEQGHTLGQLLKNPKISSPDIMSAAAELSKLSKDILLSLEISMKYEGYIRRQIEEVERIRKVEDMPIPPTFDFDSVIHLSNEAKEKLKKEKPATVGQAMRFAALRDGDLSLLVMFLSRKNIVKDA